jgi:hypothetical protein
MKKNTFLVLGLLILTVTMVFAQAKPPKAKKVLDASIPIEESAIIYVPKGSTVFQCDDTVFGKIVPLTIGNLKGDGGDLLGKIAKPILQVPAGERTITASAEDTKFDVNRKITSTFLPGHYYQIVYLAKGNPGQAIAGMMKASLSGNGTDWCFFDITEEVKAGKKKFDWEKAVIDGVLGEGQVIEHADAYR